MKATIIYKYKQKNRFGFPYCPSPSYPITTTIIIMNGIIITITSLVTPSYSLLCGVWGWRIQVTCMGQYITSMFICVSGWHLIQTKCSLWEAKMVVLGKCIIWWREGKGMVWHKGILWRRRWYRWSPSISLGQPDRVASRWWINRQTTIATRKGVRLSGKPMFYDLYDKCKGKLVLKTARWDMAKNCCDCDYHVFSSSNSLRNISYNNDRTNCSPLLNNPTRSASILQ